MTLAHDPSSSPDPTSTLTVASASDDVVSAATRWVGAVGLGIDVATDVVSLRRAWRTSQVVFVGHDLVHVDVPRRDGVIVVGTPSPILDAQAMRLGAMSVVETSDDETAIAHLFDCLDGDREGALVSILPVVGGAGASTLATLLALEAARRSYSTALVDADLQSAGADLLLGAEHVDGARWSDLADVESRLSADSVINVLPQVHGIRVLAPDRTPQRPPKAPNEVVRAIVRASDAIFVDCGRSSGRFDEVLSASHLVVLVIPERIAAVAAARHVLAQVRERNPVVVAVTVAASGGTSRHTIAKILDIPVVARVRFDPRIAQRVESGRGMSKSRRWNRAVNEILALVGLDKRHA